MLQWERSAEDGTFKSVCGGGVKDTVLLKLGEAYYLARPVSKEEWMRELEGPVPTVGEEPPHGEEQPHGKEPSHEEERLLVFRSRGSIVKIEINNICYIESRQKNLVICQGEENVIIKNRKLRELAQELPQDFFRCHQSFLVNMRYIRKFVGQEIELRNGKKIPVSRSRQTEVKKLFLDYLKNSPSCFFGSLANRK